MVKIKIPRNELEIDAVRSSGKGGQNVNKRSTKAVVSWDFKSSKILSDLEKEMILVRVPERFIDAQGNLQTTSQAERSKQQNTLTAIKKLEKIAERALHQDPKRIATKLPRSVKERRLQDKKRHSRKKAERRRIY